MRQSILILVLVCVLGLVSCAQDEHPADRSEALPIESAEETEAAEPQISIPDFSFAKERAIYAEGEPGVKTSGFANTSETEITFENAAERAERECTIEYDSAAIFFDPAERVWKVHFYTSGMLGGDQSVYLDCSGKTILIVSGE